jgi:hypothetical protein
VLTIRQMPTISPKHGLPMTVGARDTAPQPRLALIVNR